MKSRHSRAAVSVTSLGEPGACASSSSLISTLKNGNSRSTESFMVCRISVSVRSTSLYLLSEDTNIFTLVVPAIYPFVSRQKLNTHSRNVEGRSLFVQQFRAEALWMFAHNSSVGY